MSATKSTGEPDVRIGRKSRELRQRLGLSQSALAAAIGVTFQQVQKYEKGANRISVGRLQKIAETLGVGMDYFFDGAPSPEGQTPSTTPSLSKEAVQLAVGFEKIEDTKVRRRLSALVEALSLSSDRN